MMKTERPKFLPSFLDLLKGEVEKTGWRALIPYALIVSAVAGGAVAYLIPISFWTESDWPVSTVVYTGLLTLNGLVLALGWNAFGRMYDTLFRGEFGGYLAEKELLNDYLVHITMMHWSQVCAVIISGASLIGVLVDYAPNWVQRTLFGLTILSTIYAIKQAVAAITAMNDLVWQAGVYEQLKRGQGTQGQPPLSTVAGGNRRPA